MRSVGGAHRGAWQRRWAEVEPTLARYRPARARTTRFEEAAAASECAAELARVRFTEGVADFLQVLDAERTGAVQGLGGAWAAAGGERRGGKLG